MAARIALGAGTGRLIRQLLTESSLLALLGGGLGLLIAFGGIRALKLINPGAIVRLDSLKLDLTVLVFTLGVSCFAGVIFGLVPAIETARFNVQPSLREGGRGSIGRGGRMRGLLVVGEVALTLVLLTGAGLLIRSFISLQSVDLGFTPDHLLTMRVETSAEKAKDVSGLANFYGEIIRGVQALPGVQVAGVATALPIVTPGIRSRFEVEGKAEGEAGAPRRLANNRVVSPGYFRALGIPLITGRSLALQDNAQAPFAAVINQTMAKLHWGSESPVGKRFRRQAQTGELPWLTVVGVVGDIRQAGMDANPLPEFYTPFTQEHASFARPALLLIRTSGDPISIASAVRNHIYTVDPNQPVSAVQSMDEVVAQWLGPRRFTLTLMVVFAALAMALAAVGIYGVISYGVSQRTAEIGLRVALGAQQSDMRMMILRQGLTLALAGVGIGLGASFLLTRLLSSLLFGISALDPVTFVSVSVLLTFVALLASYLPARRAAGVEPTVALRYQ